MLKFLLGFLVLANGVLFAFNAGYLGSSGAGGREPARMLNQLNAPRIRIVTPEAGATMPAANTVPAIPGSTPAVAVAANGPAPAAQRDCVELGYFDAAEARRFETQVAALSLGPRLSRRSVPEIERYIVYIPPLPDKEAADRKAGELRRLGVADFYVFTENSDLRWGISLGVFKIEEAARSHLATLMEKGVRSAKTIARPGTASKTVFQLRDLDLDAQATLARIQLAFPRQTARACAPA